MAKLLLELPHGGVKVQWLTQQPLLESLDSHEAKAVIEAEMHLPETTKLLLAQFTVQISPL